MSAYQSYLAAPSYGYDFIVATTQASINSTLRQYSYEVGEPLVALCYVTGPDGAPQQMGLDDLISRAHGSDPFAVAPDADPRTDPDLLNLTKARFMMGFRAQIGIPPVSDISKIKTFNFVTLGSTASSVTYHLMCSTFDVAQLGAGGSTWLSASQPVDSPWVFTAAVDLRLADVPGDAFSTLPDQVQAQIKNLSGSAFSVQQLLFDLDNARLLSVPEISGVPYGTPLYKVLRDYFVGAYFGQMKLSGQPLLGCTVAQPTESASTLAPTDLSIGVSPYVGATTPDQQDLSCLTYLCATDGHTLPAPVPFAWNWVDEAEASSYDGAVTISRPALVALLLKQMLPMVKANCYQPHVRVTLDSASQPVYDIRPIGGQMPQINTSCLDYVIVPYNPSHPPHFQILSFKYDASASDQAGLGGDIGKASMDCHYQAMVNTWGNKLTISQTLTINLSITKHGQTTNGTPVNVIRQDMCALDVDDFGQLAATMSTPIPSTNNATEQDVSSFYEFWTGVNAQYGDTKAIVQGVSGTLVNAIPFATMQCFVFPGGQTFSYKSVTFSQHGDLVSHLVYADPDQAPPGPILPAGQVAGSDRLIAGQWIPNDGFLISSNKLYAAYLQDDSNFVLLHCTNGAPDLGRPYWSWLGNLPSLKVGNFTGTPSFATMQADGNFVLYNGRGPADAGAPYWATGTVQQSLGQFFAIMQTDANFCVYSGSPDNITGLLFQTHTNV